MTTVKELKEQCKKMGLKKYSLLKKDELIQLLKSKGLEITSESKKSKDKKTLKVGDLKKLCKEKGVKGYSKMKKKELETLCLDKKQKESKWNREEKIAEMKSKTQQHFDPIYAEPFEEWDDESLKNAILLGSHYYTPEFIFQYIEGKYKAGQRIIKDPMTNKIISQETIKEIYKNNKRELKIPKGFHFDTSIMEVDVQMLYNKKPLAPKDYSSWNFVQISLKYTPSQIKISGGGKRLQTDRILIANIPMGISTTPGYNEVKSLDSASTSEALLVKCTNLITSGKIFTIKNVSHYQIKKCPVLQTPFKNWLTVGQKNRKKVDTTSKDAPYMKFIEEVSKLETE